MNLGRYEIESYTVNIGGTTQSRQKITYTGNNGLDTFIERYYGYIRDGYTSSKMRFRNLLWTNIKTHVIGESILIDDSDSNPQIYISLATISSIDSSTENTLIIIDSQYDPIYLEFQTELDCKQALSIFNAILENPTLDINTLTLDNEKPVIYFNEFFFDGVINIKDSLTPGPHNSGDSLEFEVETNEVDITGGLPLNNSDILEQLVDEISDNRDTISYGKNDLTIFKDTLDSTQYNQIDSVGDWIIKFTIGDLGDNSVTTIININIR
jgi:hypothetical protein